VIVGPPRGGLKRIRLKEKTWRKEEINFLNRKKSDHFI